MQRSRLPAVSVVLMLLWTVATAENSPPGFIKVAGLQMRVTRDITSNEQRILRGIDRAAKQGADFLITPEGSLSGYRTDLDREVLDQALER